MIFAEPVSAFLSRPASGAPFFPPKTAVEQRVESGQESFPGIVQTKALDAPVAAGEMEEDNPLLQTKLLIGPADDAYEREADAVAEQVMSGRHTESPAATTALPTTNLQRKCTDCQQKEEEQIRRKPASAASPSPAGLSARLESSQGGGQSLPESTRTFMESRIAADFSQVRIHTGAEAIQMNRDLQARAFTYGRDVYFGEGQYAPETGVGQRLLAHELAHVVQQSGDTARRKVVQRNLVFGPRGASRFMSGGNIHKTVIQEVTSTPGNVNLIGEGPIPGGNSSGGGTYGSADFYMPFWNGGGLPPLTGFNITVPPAPPEFLPVAKTPVLKGSPYRSWRNHAAPRLTDGGKNKKRNAAPGPDDQVDRLDFAPFKILLGELKPGGEAHAGSFLGGASQLPNYRTSLLATQAFLNTYLLLNPSMRAPGQTKTHWDLKEVGFINQMFFGPDADYARGGKGISPKKLTTELSVFKFPGGYKVADNTGLKGGLFIYRAPSHDGLWLYEWLPSRDDMLLAGGSATIETVRVRLRDNVLPTLRAKRIQRTPAPPAPNGAAFNAAYKTWRAEAEPALAHQDADRSETAAALLDTGARVPGFGHRIPARARKAGNDYKNVERWVERGSFFGRLRLALSGVFAKVKGFFQKLSQKFKLAAPGKDKTKASDKILATVFRIALDIAKAYIKLLVGRVSIDLQNRLHTGMRELVQHFFNESLGEAFQGQIQDFLKVIEDLENFKEEQLGEKFAPVLSIYEDLQWFAALRSKISAIGDVVQKVRWVIRAIQCGTPPVVGCLKLLISPLTNALIRRAIQSCTFQEEVFVPVINGLSFFRDLPRHVSDAILAGASELLPLPESWKKTLFGKQGNIDSTFKTADLDCNLEERVNALNLRFAQLEDKYGKERVQLLLDILKKNKVDKKSEIQSESELDRLDKALEELAPVSDVTLIVALERIKEAPPESFVALETLVKNLKALDPTAQEEAAKPDGEASPGGTAPGPVDEEADSGGGDSGEAGEAPAGPVVKKSPNPDVRKVGNPVTGLDVGVFISQDTLKKFLRWKARSLQGKYFPASVSISNEAGVTAQITETKIYIRSVSGEGATRVISYSYKDYLHVPAFGKKIGGGNKSVESFEIY